MRDTIKTALRNPSLSVVYRALNSYVTLINQHDSFILRAKFCGLISWSVPDEGATEAIKGFVEGGRILEVGAGNGLYSVLLNRSGVYCKPTDNYGTKYFVCDNNLTEIEKLDETQAITKYGDYEVLMMIWPPPLTLWLVRLLRLSRATRSSTQVRTNTAAQRIMTSSKNSMPTGLQLTHTETHSSMDLAIPSHSTEEGQRKIMKTQVAIVIVIK